jgi:hypothetical protein
VALGPWRLLRPGTGPIVLCVDFTQARARAQAGFADLATLLPERYAVWGTEEAAWRSGWSRPEPAIESLVAGRPDGAVAGVLGYCAGGALARAIARQLAHRDAARTPVVLFDPVAVTARTLLDSYDASVRSIAAVAPRADPPPAPDHPAAPDPASAPAALDDQAENSTAPDDPTLLDDPTVPDDPTASDDPAVGPDLARLADGLARRYASLARPACAGAGVPPTIADQLCDRMHSYLRYLTYCAGARVDWPGPAVVVLSAAHEPRRIQRAWPQVRLAATQNDLLAERDAAEIAVRALAGEPLAATT